MTKPLPFTESRIRRAIAAMRKEGLAIDAVSIAPDGTVTILQAVAASTWPAQNHELPRSEKFRQLPHEVRARLKAAGKLARTIAKSRYVADATAPLPKPPE